MEIPISVHSRKNTNKILDTWMSLSSYHGFRPGNMPLKEGTLGGPTSWLMAAIVTGWEAAGP
jgi:hypothetical protein